MQSLDGKKRDIFEVVGEKGLFSVEKQSIKLSERDLSDTGQIPVFSSQTSNNGVMGFTNKVADFFIKDTPALIFGDHTKSMDISNHSFCAADNVKVLRPQNIPFDALLYVSCAWKKRIPGMGYARHWRKAKKVGIELPVTDSGKPDYAYMEEYVQQKRDTMLAKYRAYVEARIAELGDLVEIPALDEKEWKPIAIASIFSFVRGRESNMVMLEDGDVPLISAKNGSNGLKGFVETPKKLIHSDCITLNNDGDGGAGLAYYQPANMALDTHVTALVPKLEMSNWTMLFIAKSISGLHGFFGHGLSISNARAKNVRVMLPVDDNGEPDYAYMEQYAKNMMLRKYEQYLDFLKEGDATSGC